MFSIILPSYLGEYKNSATNKEQKLKRALDSIFSQTFADFELIVVSDGCDKTVEICEPYDLNLFKIPKQPLMSGTPRNIGIEKAKRDWIIYLDSDDVWGANHLEKITEGMCCSYKWFFFNDWTVQNNEWKERQCNVRVKGSCGTSNITHRRTLPVKWRDGYLHDWLFIQELNKYEVKKIGTPEYFVMHIPSRNYDY